jgi:chalcone isomerase-like protein
MLTIRWAWISLALLLNLTAGAAELDGVALPAKVKMPDGPELVLNGAGVRTDKIVKLYVAGLYLPDRTQDAEAILRANKPSRLQLHLLHDMTSDQLTSSIKQALSETLTPDQRSPLQARLDQLTSIFDRLKVLKKGTQVVIDYLPRRGTAVRINDEERGRIAGADFKEALLRMWIGDHPRDPQLRKAMLGIR